MPEAYEIAVRSAQTPLLIGLDIGSTASRGMLFDLTGHPVRPRVKVAHQFETAPDGTSIIDPDQIVAEVTSIIDQLVTIAEGHEIVGVALDTFASSLIGVSDSGHALTPCFNYNDNRCAQDAFTLRESYDEDAYQERTGCRFHASYLPARLRWLERTEPELLAEVARWLSLGEYVHLHLLGHASAGTSVAAWSGLLNRATGTWDDEALAMSGITASQLSTIADPSVALQPLKKSRAHRMFPALRHSHWFAPIGDGYAATRGVGEGTDSIVISLATSGAMRVLMSDPVGSQGIKIPNGLWAYRVDSQHTLVGGAVNDVGRATEWLNRELKLPDPKIVAAQLLEPPSTTTPLVLPFFTGERSVGWRGDLRSTWHNLDFSTSALELYRGVLEGIVWTFQRIADQLADLTEVNSARVGGRVMAEAPGILSVMADGLTLDITPVDIKRSTLQGLAFIALDVLAPGGERVKVQAGETLRHDPTRAAFYDNRQLLLDNLYAEVTRAG